MILCVGTTPAAQRVMMFRELGDEAAVLGAMKELSEQGAHRAVVTAGQEPTLAWDGRQPWGIAGPTLKAVNPIGSGDAFTAGLAWRLASGDDLGEARGWGVAAGGANALTPMPGGSRPGRCCALVTRGESREDLS
jgi:tagatose 6-phosphate kinase